MQHIINPNTGHKHQINETKHNQIQSTIEQLKLAQNYWQQQPLSIRIKKCKHIQKKLINHKRQLAMHISKETGKPFWESSTEINAAISKIDSAITSLNYRCKFPINETPIKVTKTICKPYGIIAVIGPFNFPIHIPHGQIIPSLLTGNAIVLKPSEYVPNTSKFYLKLIKECFKNEPCPIDIVFGSKTNGETIINHSNTDFIFFTGSYETGRIIEKNVTP